MEFVLVKWRKDSIELEISKKLQPLFKAFADIMTYEAQTRLVILPYQCWHDTDTGSEFRPLKKFVDMAATMLGDRCFGQGRKIVRITEFHHNPP